MKKSEAVRRFNEWIWSNQSQLEYKDEYEKCSLALDFLVNELKMLPPAAKLDIIDQVDNAWEAEKGEG